jgi:hypothetical protein
VGGGEEHRHRASLGDPEDRRALAAGGVHHRLQVVHRLLQGRRPPGPVGEALLALVEDDEPRERGEATEEAGDRGISHVHLHVGDETGDEDEVERALPVHLVGDADPAGVGVVGVGFHRVHFIGPEALLIPFSRATPMCSEH